jgi:tRNA-specific 2-thiouridylase
MSGERVVVAMSGGVDSSLAAAILKDQGYEVIGVTMQLWSGEGCSDYCGLEAVEMACSVADRLDIPHYVLDFKAIFKETVIADFCSEYSRGRTPNPCIVCNRYIKFDALLNWAFELNAVYLATGHYARIDSSTDGCRLLKAIDTAKDQSYFLYRLEQRQLKHLLFPIGHLKKSAVREMATELGLTPADRRESQDICFLLDGDYRSFISERIPLEPGDIMDTKGRLMGRHKGLPLYTVGQRQGLGLAANRRLYVLRLEPETNRIVVGGSEQLLIRCFTVGKLHWISGKTSELSNSIMARIRHGVPEVPVKLKISSSGSTEACFNRPQSAVTPGQSVVFYRGDIVLGGGIIDSTYNGG